MLPFFGPKWGARAMQFFKQGEFQQPPRTYPEKPAPLFLDGFLTLFTPNSAKALLIQSSIV
jgi:hypothetical protein